MDGGFGPAGLVPRLRDGGAAVTQPPGAAVAGYPPPQPDEAGLRDGRRGLSGRYTAAGLSRDHSGMPSKSSEDARITVAACHSPRRRAENQKLQLPRGVGQRVRRMTDLRFGRVDSWITGIAAV